MPEPRMQRQAEEEEEEEELIQTKPLAEQITPLVQRQVEPEEEEELIQAKTAGDVTPEVTPVITSGIQSLQDGGQPLSKRERSFFEPRFGVDFSNVRVHDDTRAASVTRLVNARAFTFGRNVVFSAGEYSPDVSSGKKLLAHELTHVVQQNGAPTIFSTGKNSENTIPNSQELSIVSPKFSSRSNLRVQRTSYRNCESSSEREVLQESISQARRDLTTTVQFLNAATTNQDVQDSLWLAFRVRPNNTDAIRRIRSNLVMVNEGLNGATIECEYDNDPDSQCNGILGWTYGRGPIHICINQFFLKDVRVQAGTIVHESCHRYGNLTDIAGYFSAVRCRETPSYMSNVEFPELGTARGTEGTTPGLRLITADNYSCFVYFLAHERRFPSERRRAMSALTERARTYRGENLRITAEYDPEIVAIQGDIYLGQRENLESFVLVGVPEYSGFTLQWELQVDSEIFEMQPAHATGGPAAMVSNDVRQRIQEEMEREDSSQRNGRVVCHVRYSNSLGETASLLSPPPSIGARLFIGSPESMF